MSSSQTHQARRRGRDGGEVGWGTGCLGPAEHLACGCASCSALSPAWDCHTCQVLRGGYFPISPTRVPHLPLDIGLGGRAAVGTQRRAQCGQPLWGQVPSTAEDTAGTDPGQRESRRPSRAEAATAPGAIPHGRHGVQLEGAAQGRGRRQDSEALQLWPALLRCCRSFVSLFQLISPLPPQAPALTLPETANLCPAEAEDT